MKKMLLILSLLSAFIGSSQCTDPVLTDFECGTPSHPFSGGVTVGTIANPFLGGINTSANVGEATDDGTEPFDAVIIDYGAPIDLATNPIFHIKIYTEITTPIPFVAKVEGGTTPLEILTSIDDSDQWMEYTSDFSSVANNGNTTLVLFFNFNQTNGTTTDTYYIDDMFFGAPPTICSDPILTDFECDIPSHPFTGGVMVDNIANPFSGGINTSANVGEATDNGTEPFDAVIIDYGAQIDLTTNPIFHIKIYTELTTPIPFVAKVEGGTTPLEVSTTIDDTDQWAEYTFDFSSVADSGNTRLVLFFNFNQSNGTTTDTYYIDDMFFGPPPTMCSDPILTDFECDIPSHPFTGGVMVNTIANPFLGGANTSASVGEATDNGTEPFDAIIVDYGSPIDLTTNPIFHITVYTELTTPIPFVAKVEGGTTPLEISTTIDVSDQWMEFTFDFSSVADSGNTTLVIFFNFNQSNGTTTDTYYIDDLFFGPSNINTFTYVDDATGWMPNDPSDSSNPSTVDDDVLVIAGTATLTENLVANNVSIETGAVLNAQGINVSTSLSSAGTTNIFGTLIPNSAQISSSGSLILKSTAMGTATVADASMATFNDNITVERYIPASNRAFRLLSTPVEGAGAISENWQNNTHITGAGGSTNGFDQTATNAPSMFTVNEQSIPASYEAISSTTETTLNHGTGYLILIRGDRSIDLTNNDDTPTETTLSSSGSLFTGTQFLGPSVLNQGDFQAGGNGSSLIANPYQAPVDMEKVLNTSSQINQEFIHVYDPTLGDRGAFVTVGFGDEADGSNDDTNFTFGSNSGNDASPTTATRFLQPGSAVFVNTINPGVDGNASPSITFNESDKAIDNQNSGPFRTSATRSESDDKRINITLYDTESLTTGGTPRDGLTIRFSEEYSNTIEMTDAYKAFNLDENFSSHIDGNDFSIQSRALPLVNEQVALSISDFRTFDYTFKAQINGFDNMNVYLVDNYSGIQSLIENNEETQIQFSVNPDQALSVASDRFNILFEEKVLGIDNNLASNFTMYPNPVRQGQLSVQISNLELTDGSLSLYNMLGQKVSTTDLDANALRVSIDVSNLNSGVYIIKLSANGTATSQLLIIQ